VRPLLLLSLLPLVACVSSSATVRQSPATDARQLTFIHDDYPRALAEARETGRPLFIDFWAPWCHTCRSMNANVFPDARLAPLGERFVFLSVDTEKPENAAVVERFPLSAWPTLLVVEPQEERAVLRWLGSATVEQLGALLEDGARAVKGGAEGADALLARADRLYAEGDAQGAVTLLAQVLAEAPADWSRRSRAVESSLMALALGKDADPEACARLAVTELERLPRSASWANVSAWGLGCALEVPDSAEWRAHIVGPLETRVKEALGEPRIDMAGDDRSGLYAVWLGARQAAKDEPGARAVAMEWLTFLERVRAEAPNADARAPARPALKRLQVQQLVVRAGTGAEAAVHVEHERLRGLRERPRAVAVLPRSSLDAQVPEHAVLRVPRLEAQQPAALRVADVADHLGEPGRQAEG